MPRKNEVTLAGGGRDERLQEIGRRIASARKKRGLEQKDLATLVQVTEKTISNYEVGKSSPHLSLSMLAAALHVSEGWIWEGDGDGIDEDRICRLLEEILKTSRYQVDELRLLRMRLDERTLPV